MRPYIIIMLGYYWFRVPISAHLVLNRLAVKKTAAFSIPIFIKVNYINQVIHQFMYLVLFIVVATVRLCGDILWIKGGVTMFLVFWMCTLVFLIFGSLLKQQATNKYNCRTFLEILEWYWRSVSEKRPASIVFPYSQIYIMSVLKYHCCFYTMFLDYKRKQS